MLTTKEIDFLTELVHAAKEDKLKTIQTFDDLLFYERLLRKLVDMGNEAAKAKGEI